MIVVTFAWPLALGVSHSELSNVSALLLLGVRSTISNLLPLVFISWLVVTLRERKRKKSIGNRMILDSKNVQIDENPFWYRVVENTFAFWILLVSFVLFAFLVMGIGSRLL